MSTYLITGANRGIGFEMSRILTGRGDKVIAACRVASSQLLELGVEVLENVDVSQPESIKVMANSLEGRPIDVLINNAGILSREPLSDLDLSRIQRQFEVNTLGPLLVSQAMLPNLSAGGKLIIVTSRMGSVADNTSGGMYGYRISKAGVNMVGKSLAEDLRDQGIAVRLLHPGMVATEMTGGNGIPPEEAASGLLSRIDELTIKTTGELWHANGERLPW
jgi:NAD(P)-dependent dehydrogenase (short-subunit alcohol dehydrogenase family)